MNGLAAVARRLGIEQWSSLRGRVVTGSLWSFGGYAVNQVLRLAGNLILTRLLFPEAFGLMALVQVFMTGLEMFSDIGIIPSIIQHRRGEEQPFLNTAWTIQVGRGFVLFIGAWAIATPAGLLYKEPILQTIIPVVGLNSIIQGFNSTSLAVANRQLLLGRVTTIEIGSYLLSLMAMIGWALVSPTVWAIVAGGLVGSMAKMLLSHFALPGPRNRFGWEKEAFWALQRYGKWIFFSTALTFLAGQGDRLLMGRLLDVNMLAYYTIALTLSRLLTNVFQHVAGKAFFPSYAELARADDWPRLYGVIRKSRIVQISSSWGFAVALVVGGEALIGLLYDPRYADAGWIMQLLALGSLLGVLESSYGGVLLAIGKPKVISLLLIFQTAVQLILMGTGYLLGGSKGFIVGAALWPWFFYPINAVVFARLRLWQPEVDLPVLLLSAAVLLVFWQLL